MAVELISNLSSKNQIDEQYGAKKRNTGELGKDDFLKLLITQLKYQDPLRPMDDKEFIAQMAQFSTLEQMQNLNSNFAAMKAFSLLGKNISGSITSDTGEKTNVNGIVEKVWIEKGKVFVHVADRDVPVDQITEVSNANDQNSQSIQEKLNGE